jgi:hypothetical protein
MRSPIRWFDHFVEKALSRGIAYTSLDAMKLFAIVNMTVDHIGLYCFPHELWWRTLGRITFPVWFFLAGYSRSRRLSTALWIYAAILILDRPFMAYPLLPLNALVSIILCHFLLNKLEDYQWLPSALPWIIITFIPLTFFTTSLFEYGSIAFLFALFGRMIALKEKKYFWLLFITSYVTFLYWQFLWFKFNLAQGIYVSAGTLWVMWWLAHFTNKVIWPDWHASKVKTFITVLSRNTVPYYFYHLLFIEILAALLIDQGFHFALRLHN